MTAPVTFPAFLRIHDDDSGDLGHLARYVQGHERHDEALCSLPRLLDLLADTNAPAHLYDIAREAHRAWIGRSTGVYLRTNGGVGVDDTRGGGVPG